MRLSVARHKHCMRANVSSSYWSSLAILELQKSVDFIARMPLSPSQQFRLPEDSMDLKLGMGKIVAKCVFLEICVTFSYI